MDDRFTFTPYRVKRLRLALKLTQEQFAAKLGCTLFTITRWESGHTAPRAGPLVGRLLELEREVKIE